MKIHGLVCYETLAAEACEPEAVTFRFDGSGETRQRYPFDFTYRIAYRLEKNLLRVTNHVENRGTEKMYFAVGGHPGFNVPLEEGLAFEDYCLEFDRPCSPSRIGFSPTCFMTGKDTVFPLEDGRKLHLRHDLFDEDAIVLKHAERRVRLGSEKGARSVTVTYPDFPYIGFWHKPCAQAPYVCIEPWSSLPSREGIVEDFAQQSDLISLEPRGRYSAVWTAEFN